MERERKSGWAVLAFGMLVLVPFLYVLSIGPMLWLCEHGFIPPRVSENVPLYAPLQWLANRSTVFEALLEWYTGLWMSSLPLSSWDLARA